MKSLHLSICFFLLFSFFKGKAQTGGCYPDKGIRLAKTTASLDGEPQEGVQEISFDREGRPVLRTISSEGNSSTTTYHYEGEKLLYTIQESQLPSWLGEGESTTQRDTSKVDGYDEVGRPLEMGGIDNLKQTFSYVNCEQEIQTLLSTEGDTVQQYVMHFENGVLIQTIWTPHQPVKSSHTSTYYDYVFNKKGHWVKRSYRHEGKGEVVEKRKLKYY